jgi:carbonic anhydrase/acetyltransferase-like protein (isoleucine patch superfamily)
MSWKQYGGIKHLDTNTNIRVNNIVSDSLILTSQISGDYNIDGNLVVSEHSLLNDVSMNGNVVFNGNVVINGNLLTRQGVFDENVLFIKGTYFGPDISNSSFFIGYNNNIGLNNTTPIATFDISGNKVSSLIVKSNLPYTKNIISQNINGKGISVATSDASSCIEFYNDNSIYGNSNAKIKYNVNGVLEIDVSSNTEILSNVSISNRSVDHILNETMVVYDNSSGIYFKDIYNNPYSITGNAASFIANDNSSNTFLNVITPNGYGARYGGGVYPYDTSRAMNTFGIMKDLNYIPSHTIVSGNDPVKYKTTTGINTYKPKVDNYVLDVNGPIHIDNCEISIIYDVSFQIIAMNSIKNNKQYIAAVGTSVDISGSTVLFGENYYRKYFICSKDGGMTWNNINITGFFNVETQKVANNINDIFLYDTSSCFIVGDKQAFLYSNDGYNTFYRIAYPVNTNITNVYVSDLVSNTWRVWFSCSNATLCYFDMSKNTIGNISPSMTINNLSNNIKRLDGYGNYIYYNYNNVFEKRDISNNIIPLVPVNKTFNSIFVFNENTVIGVGLNNISITYDGGYNWIHTNLTGNFYKGYIFDLSNSVAIDNSYNLYYSINNTWNNISYNVLNSNGMGDVITNTNNHFSNVLMTDINNILVSNTNTYYDYINQYGNSNLFYMFLPNLFNRLNNDVIDICGNMKISGDLYINENGELKSTNSTFNLLNENVNEINIGGDSTLINIGNAMGGTTYIKYNLDVSGIITGYSDMDISANLYVNQMSVLNGDVSMNANLFVGQDVSLNADLYVHQRAILNGDVSLNSDLYVHQHAILNGDVSLNSDLYVHDHAILNGDVSLNSDLYVHQHAILNGDVSLNADLYVQENTILNGDVSLNSDLYVHQHAILNGDVSLNADLYVDQHAILNGDVSLNSDLYVQQNTILNGDVSLNSDLYVHQHAVLNGDVSLNSDLYVQQNTILNGDVSMNSDLYVHQHAILNGDVSMNADLYVHQNSVLNGDVLLNANLYVNQDVSLNSDLYVQQKSILNGDVSMNSKLYVNDKSTLNGNVTINSNLYVLNDISLNSDLYVQQKSILNGDVSMNGNLCVNQNSVFNGDVSMNGNLLVNNFYLTDLYINNNSILNGDVSMNSHLFVADDVSLNSKLFVNQTSILNGDVSMNSHLFVADDVSLNSNLFVNQRSILNGDVSMNSHLFVTDDVSLNSNLYVNQRSILHGDVSMNSHLFVTDDVSLNSNLFVNQRSTLNGDVSMNSHLFVADDVSLNSKLFVNQTSILNGDVSMNSHLFVANDVSLNSKLFVNQTSILNGDVSMNHNLDVSNNITSSTIHVTGNSLLNNIQITGNLLVNQHTIFNHDVSMNGNLYVNNKSVFNGITQLNNLLFSTSDVSFNGNLFVNNKTILNGDVSMNGNINLNSTYINGNLYVYKNFVVSNNVQEFFSVKSVDNNNAVLQYPEINIKAITHVQNQIYCDSYTNVYSGVIVDTNSVYVNKTFTCTSEAAFANKFSLSNSGFDTNISSLNITLTTSTGNISLISPNIILSRIVTVTGLLNTENIISSGNINAINMYASTFTSNSVVGIGVNATLVSIGSLTSGALTRNEIRIGNYTLDTTKSSHIVIGGPGDTVDFYTTPTIISTVTPVYQTKTFLLNSGVDKTNTSFGSGIFVSDNTPNDVSENPVAFFAVSNDMKAWNLKAPFGTSVTNSTSNVVGIRVNELVNTNNINGGLLKLVAGNTISQGSNYNITPADIDISNVFIKYIDTKPNQQNVSTDVSMNGNLFVSNVCIGTDNSNNYTNSLQIKGNIYQTTTYSNGFILQF